MKANSSARAVNKFLLASTITAIQTVKTVVAQAITVTEMEPLVQTIMSCQECNSNTSDSNFHTSNSEYNDSLELIQFC